MAPYSVSGRPRVGLIRGIVEKLGAGVQGFSRGDQVLAWAYHTYAELCAVKVELLARVPNGMNLVDAAALRSSP